MFESKNEAGIQPGGKVTRENFIKLMGLGLFGLTIGCQPVGQSPEPTRQPAQSPIVGETLAPAITQSSRALRSQEGVWGDDHITQLAQMMVSETGYYQLVETGQWLLANARRTPSLSKVSSTFSDEKIEVVTRDIAPQGKTLPPLVESNITETGAPLRLTVKHKSRNPNFDYVADMREKLKLSSVVFNGNTTRDLSDFGLMLLMATRLYYPRAIELAVPSALDFYAQGGYILPTSGKQLEGLKIQALVNVKINEIPLAKICGQIGWFHLVPTYQLAADRGRVSDTDKTAFKELAALSTQFRDRGVMLQAGDGTYGWTIDSNILTQNWFDAAMTLESSNDNNLDPRTII